MKFFEYKIIDSLADVSKKALICFGKYNKEVWIKMDFDVPKDKRISPWFRFVEDMIKEFVKGGFYLVINSPFKIKSHYVSVIDFLKKYGIIKHRWAFSLRKQFYTTDGNEHCRFYFNKVKCPLNDKCEVDCIDPAFQGV